MCALKFISSLLNCKLLYLFFFHYTLNLLQKAFLQEMEKGERENTKLFPTYTRSLLLLNLPIIH
ncbi:hypothetical protein FDUTEX481_09932 [Tolypothrix sp. PCC 7601]|nr:hypothetical protein FDUTEX481_09932 [Tolypothrix sp. PCC 7601]